VVGMLPVEEFADDLSVFMATRLGTVKKTAASSFAKIRITGIKAIGIDEGDELVEVKLTRANMDVVLVTKNGRSIRFQEDQVRPMGREARGVRGLTLADGDALVGMSAFARDCNDAILTICQNGYGKRTQISEYPTQGRGGKGVIAIKTSQRNGPVAAVRLVADDDHVILISSRGKLIRLRVRDIPVQSRATQGVRVMRLDAGEHVVSVERLADPEEDGEIVKVEGIAGNGSDGDEAADDAAGDEEALDEADEGADEEVLDEPGEEPGDEPGDESDEEPDDDESGELS
jgi:DNA gyrase subunit A